MSRSNISVVANGSSHDGDGSALVGDVTFRSCAMNAVAIVPLLCKDNNGSSGTHSLESFQLLMTSLRSYSEKKSNSGGSTGTTSSSNGGDGCIRLVVPNVQLTRPGDWRYESTPLKSHDWTKGCQRMVCFDGRPNYSRMASDRLSSNKSYKDWMEYCPSRGTAAVIGVLNVKDCYNNAGNDTTSKTEEMKKLIGQAEDELTEYWLSQYSNGSSVKVTRRLFIFDSFEFQEVDDYFQSCRDAVVAFPPMTNPKMMDLHYNVVVNDLCVSIFSSIERKINQLEQPATTNADSNNRHQRTSSTSNPLFFRNEKSNNNNKNNTNKDQPTGNASGLVGIGQLANMVSSNHRLSITSTSDTDSTTHEDDAGSQQQHALRTKTTRLMSAVGNLTAATAKAIHNAKVNAANANNNNSNISSAGDCELFGLSTPMDRILAQYYQNSSKKERLKKQMSRNKKMAADLALLAGSPLDAYERYTKAAESSKSLQDHVWYAAALEGCAASFIAMADIGGHGVDYYLENNFQLPDDILALTNISDSSTSISQSNNLNNTNHKSSGGSNSQKHKTTLPSAVLALCEEALNITNRHLALAPIHVELLLKLAWYSVDLEESHLRCRWGEADDCCFGGVLLDYDDNVMSEEELPLRRWEVHPQQLLELEQTNKLTSRLNASTIQRMRTLSDWFHRAISHAGMDAPTRTDCALTCAKLAIRGMKTTHWAASSSSHNSSNTNDSYIRIPMLRKAAYFTTVAAEYSSNSKPHIWYSASQLYSSTASSYGWASLRATIYQGLMNTDSPHYSDLASQKFLHLLCELSPNTTTKMTSNKQQISRAHSSNYSNSNHTNAPMEETEESLLPNTLSSSLSSEKAASQNKKHVFLPHRWNENPPISMIPLPFTTSSCSSLDKAVLNCVIPNIPLHQNRLIQEQIIQQLHTIRTNASTTTTNSGNRMTPPIVVESAKLMDCSSHLVLNRTKAAGFGNNNAATKDQSMATFFNPYDKQNSNTTGNTNADGTSNNNNDSVANAILIAQGEERTIKIQFSNRLSVPLFICTCQLQFKHSSQSSIEAPPLSFTLPPKAKNFVVYFPFLVHTNLNTTTTTTTTKTESSKTNILDLIGLQVAIFNRSFTIPFQTPPSTNEEENMIPAPASVYQRSTHNHTTNANNIRLKQKELSVQLETVPAQPNLLVSFTTSLTPLEDNASVPVHLSDGEIYTIPPFRLENDFGPSGLGSMERLQIVGVGLPGLSDEILFDTDELAQALEEEEGDDFTDTSSEDDDETSSDYFEELMESDGLPPLKMKCLADGLSLASINDKSKSMGEGSVLTFQMAATHDMGNQLANGGNVRIRFRIRGPSSTPGLEIWRKREVSLKIVRVKGPRISSLTFRSDLSWKSAYSELCHALAQQKQQWQQVPKWETSKLILHHPNKQQQRSSLKHSKNNVTMEDSQPVANNDTEQEENSVLYRVGTDQGVYVSGEDIVVLMAVANETNETIVLSNRQGMVGGFQGSPMPTVTVTSGVSVKIPVVIPRIERIDEATGEIVDIAAELIARTALQWNVPNKTRHGRVRIPSKCLREIMDNYKSFASRICRPPISVTIATPGKEGEEIHILPGDAVDTFVSVDVQDWVPPKVKDRCCMTMEFCCARKDTGETTLLQKEETEKKDTFQKRADFFWCGQLRRTVTMSPDTHTARVAFLEPGTYVVSACAKLSQYHQTEEEIWWAPHAKIVHVSSPNS